MEPSNGNGDVCIIYIPNVLCPLEVKEPLDHILSVNVSLFGGSKGGRMDTDPCGRNYCHACSSLTLYSHSFFHYTDGYTVMDVSNSLCVTAPVFLLRLLTCNFFCYIHVRTCTLNKKHTCSMAT